MEWVIKISQDLLYVIMTVNGASLCVYTHYVQKEELRTLWGHHRSTRGGHPARL